MIMEPFIVYDNLVRDILKVNALKDYVDKQERRGTHVNLVCLDWREKLKNYVVYQRHANRYDDSLFHKAIKTDFCETEFVKNNNRMYLTLALPCRFASNYENAKPSFSIYSKASEPLLMVAQAMTRDKNQTHKVIDESKFSCDTCGYLICANCNDFYVHCIENGIDMDNSAVNPCIVKTKVYNGKAIANRFASQIQSGFQMREFIGIFNLEVSMRIMFNRKSDNQLVVRIGGRLSEMLVFDQNKLEQNDNVQLDFDILKTFIKPPVKPLINKPSRAQKEKANEISVPDSLPFEELNRDASVAKRPTEEEDEIPESSIDVIDVAGLSNIGTNQSNKRKKTCKDTLYVEDGFLNIA